MPNKRARCRAKVSVFGSTLMTLRRSVWRFVTRNWALLEKKFDPKPARNVRRRKVHVEKSTGDRHRRSPVPNLSLPNSNAIFRFEIQLVAGLHVERGVPRIHVAFRERAARRARRMRVGQHLRAKRIVAGDSAPRIGEREEEPLIAGE